MNYSNISILLQEVPDEITLGIVFTGCGNRCIDCHSVENWNKNHGEVFNNEILISYLNKYENMITCVCFFGGEWCLSELLEYIKIVKLSKLKTCLYTGLSTDDIYNSDTKILINNLYLDYIKTGPYIKELGGLQSKNTNQRFFKIKSKDLIIDMTSTFEVK